MKQKIKVENPVVELDGERLAGPGTQREASGRRLQDDVVLVRHRDRAGDVRRQLHGPQPAL